MLGEALAKVAPVTIAVALVFSVLDPFLGLRRGRSDDPVRAWRTIGLSVSPLMRWFGSSLHEQRRNRQSREGSQSWPCSGVALARRRRVCAAVDQWRRPSQRFRHLLAYRRRAMDPRSSRHAARRYLFLYESRRAVDFNVLVRANSLRRSL